MILFDGVCNLCTGSVQFVIARDPRGRFAFASLQSNAAARLLAGRGFPSQNKDMNSFVLVEGDRISTRSTAILRTARALGFPWSLAYPLIAIPRPLRDWAYRVIARTRYRWFGKRDVCLVPTPDLQARFLSD